MASQTARWGTDSLIELIGHARAGDHCSGTHWPSSFYSFLYIVNYVARSRKNSPIFLLPLRNSPLLFVLYTLTVSLRIDNEDLGDY